eukprot:GGOE01011215.1.p2 GENE.GGOE01011215.1~~GGOE01011215.1.p2  ORF type:complete len:118 (+),score=8.80 GGOE01011215.1:622-975(+)
MENATSGRGANPSPQRRDGGTGMQWHKRNSVHKLLCRLQWQECQATHRSQSMGVESRLSEDGLSRQSIRKVWANPWSSPWQMVVQGVMELLAQPWQRAGEAYVDTFCTPRSHSAPHQ